MNGAIKNIQLSKEGNLSFDEILRNVSSLDTKEIVQFMHEISRIVAQRRGNILPQRESELLEAINESVPSKLQFQYDTLAIKLNNETISEEEHKQLLKIIGKLEQKKAKKLEYMMELARLRNITLKELAHQLQMQNAFYA